MDLIHKRLNNLVGDMEQVVRKGVPFAKRNKDRRVRAILRSMRAKQAEPPKFADVWFYFRSWLTAKVWKGGKR